MAYPANILLRSGGLGFFIPEALRPAADSIDADFNDMVFGGNDHGATGIRWAHLAGPVTSSTRAEVSAIAVTLAINAPLGVASDSSAAVARFSKLILECNSMPRAHQVGDTVTLDMLAPLGVQYTPKQQRC